MGEGCRAEKGDGRKPHNVGKHQLEEEGYGPHEHPVGSLEQPASLPLPVERLRGWDPSPPHCREGVGEEGGPPAPSKGLPALHQPHCPRHPSPSHAWCITPTATTQPALSPRLSGHAPVPKPLFTECGKSPAKTPPSSSTHSRRRPGGSSSLLVTPHPAVPKDTGMQRGVSARSLPTAKEGPGLGGSQWSRPALSTGPKTWFRAG